MFTQPCFIQNNMTREEERKTSSSSLLPISGSLHEERAVSAFVRGAKWADENQPGMSKMRKDYELLFLLKKQELIKKACEWLNKTLYIHTEEIEDKHWNEIKTFDWVTSDFDSVSDFIEEFRKAVEE